MDHPALLRADWPAPPGVHGFTTLRHGAGVSDAPFDRFNLGTALRRRRRTRRWRNRDALARIGGLPSAPAWLRQVHGVGVVRVPDGSRFKGAPPDPPLDPQGSGPKATRPRATPR